MEWNAPGCFLHGWVFIDYEIPVDEGVVEKGEGEEDSVCEVLGDAG